MPGSTTTQMAQGRCDDARTTQTPQGRTHTPPRTTRSHQGQHEQTRDDPNRPGTRRTPQGRPERLKDDMGTPRTVRTEHGRPEQTRDDPKDNPKGDANGPGTTRRDSTRGHDDARTKTRGGTSDNNAREALRRDGAMTVRGGPNDNSDRGHHDARGPERQQCEGGPRREGA